MFFCSNVRADKKAAFMKGKKWRFKAKQPCKKGYKLVELPYMEIIVYIPILFFSIVLHEFAHGLAAYRLGDDTAYLSGRLTLNPIAHIDIMGTLVVPAFCYLFGMPLFGWAKPVPVNPLRLDSPKRDMGKVAAAGPAVNLVLALVLVLIMKIVILTAATASAGVEQALVFLQYGVLINVLLAVFNLMPIPPLDGGNIVTSLLPVNASIRYQAVFGRYGMYIVLALILTGAVKYILLPPVYLILNALNKFLML